MVANHPDAGGSHYLASKINEAKDVMTGKTKGGGSAFWSVHGQRVLPLKEQFCVSRLALEDMPKSLCVLWKFVDKKK